MQVPAGWLNVFQTGKQYIVVVKYVGFMDLFNCWLHHKSMCDSEWVRGRNQDIGMYVFPKNWWAHHFQPPMELVLTSEAWSMLHYPCVIYVTLCVWSMLHYSCVICVTLSCVIYVTLLVSWYSECEYREGKKET